MIKIVLLSFSLLFPSIAFACLSSKEDNFNHWDKNGDGFVTLDEYEPDAAKSPKKITAEEQKIIDSSKEDFDKADKNHNGKIDWEERRGLPPILCGNVVKFNDGLFR